MNKNGFTLVELLATIFILAIVIIIAYPVYTSVSKSVRESNLETTKVMLINSMLDYGNKYLIDEIKPSGNTCSNNNCCKYYPIDYLISYGIFQSNNNEILNPVTNKPLTGYIKLSYNTSKFVLEGQYEENDNNAGNCEVIEL